MDTDFTECTLYIDDFWLIYVGTALLPAKQRRGKRTVQISRDLMFLMAPSSGLGEPLVSFGSAHNDTATHSRLEAHQSCTACSLWACARVCSNRKGKGPIRGRASYLLGRTRKLTLGVCPMQRHSRPAESETKRSTKTYIVPLGHSTSKYETHLRSANSGKTAASEGSPYWNDEPLKSRRHSFFCRLSTISTERLSSLSEISIIQAGVPMDGLLGSKMESCSCDCVSRHFAKIKNASAGEIFVMQLALSFSPREAIALAARWNLKLRATLRALLST